ncbi:hypothetical protein LJR130_004845 [Variovorax sp. LjRoot130]|uniref:hypothetical protein n=1 Tax=Variovorax sp. LjRoot130 TaxID=3342261 RepID=UPI003ECEF44E
MKITGYINLYRSGWFHRQGKPGAFDLHAGDVYPTLESALRDIEPRTHYLATVPVCWQSDQDMAPTPPPRRQSRFRSAEPHSGLPRPPLRCAARPLSPAFTGEARTGED